MINKIAYTIALVSSLVFVASTQAEANCRALGESNIGGVLLPQANCAAIAQTLNASGQFPDIFSVSPPKLLPVCFATPPSGIPFMIGTESYNISTMSIWTNEFLPYFPPLLTGPDQLASVITQWQIKNPFGTLVGTFYTHDTADLLNFTELDVIIGGLAGLDDIKGALRVNSHPVIISASQFYISIDSISGTICNAAL